MTTPAKKESVSLSDAFFSFVLNHLTRDCKTLLDVGCGTASPVRFIKRTMDTTGIDIYPKAVSISRSKRIHDRYKVGDITKLTHIFSGTRFDAVMSIDVIEHLTKSQGTALMRNMEKLATKRVIILTPNGYLHQHAIDNNPFQTHKSGWQAQDFRDAGYTVYGLRGLRLLRDDHASIRFKPWLVWGILSAVSEVVFWFFPELSFDLFAVKQVDYKL